jgi:hypothetical protein
VHTFTPKLTKGHVHPILLCYQKELSVRKYKIANVVLSKTKGDVVVSHHIVQRGADTAVGISGHSDIFTDIKNLYTSRLIERCQRLRN